MKNEGYIVFSVWQSYIILPRYFRTTFSDIFRFRPTFFINDGNLFFRVSRFFLFYQGLLLCLRTLLVVTKWGGIFKKFAQHFSSFFPTHHDDDDDDDDDDPK